MRQDYIAYLQEKCKGCKTCVIPCYLTEEYEEEDFLCGDPNDCLGCAPLPCTKRDKYSLFHEMNRNIIRNQDDD